MIDSDVARVSGFRGVIGLDVAGVAAFILVVTDGGKGSAPGRS